MKGIIGSQWCSAGIAESGGRFGGRFAAGQSSEQILADFPDLEPEDLKYALGYTARKIDHPVLVG